MKSNLLLLAACICLLQNCSQPAAEIKKDEGATAPGANPPAGTQAPQAPPPMTESQKFFVQSQEALEKSHDPKLCMSLLDKAVAAAKTEKNPMAVILCRTTQAKLKISDQDQPAATKILEEQLKDFANAKDPQTSMALDESKALLAMLYGKAGKDSKAEAIFKDNIAAARKQEPVVHKRVAFWLQNYSDYFKFKNKPKDSEKLAKEAAAEFNK